jgi:Flp pilus assembly protein TadG
MLREKGNVLIMMALSFAVLAAFGVLAIDIGRIWVTRTQLQKAADAAALAGASLFCNSGAPAETDVKNQAIRVGDQNKALEGAAVALDIQPADVTVDAAARSVKVDTRSNTAQYFLGLPVLQLVGPRIREKLVQATATARCGGTCGVTCVKPWSIPDRWDDITPIPGYTGGGGRNAVNWVGDNHWNCEAFTDQNGNGLYDPGEPYVDGNGNGKFDQENYHPYLTGYVPDPYPGNYLTNGGDLGLELVLKSNNTGKPEPGKYWPIDLPPINKGTPVPGADEYRNNIRNCNPASVEPGDWLQTEPGNMVGPTDQGMRDLIALDPNAYWDATTQTVQGSNFAVSPRIVLIPIHDPRIATQSGRNHPLQVTKVAAFFMEAMNGNGEVRGRFIKVRNPGGTPCVAGAEAGSFTYSLNLIH